MTITDLRDDAALYERDAERLRAAVRDADSDALLTTPGVCRARLSCHAGEWDARVGVHDCVAGVVETGEASGSTPADAMRAAILRIADYMDHRAAELRDAAEDEG